MTLDEALKEIEILKLQNKKMGEAFDSLDKEYDSLKLELELAQACHNEKCAEFNKLCYDYYKFEQNMKNVLEIEKKNAVKEFAEKLKAKSYSVVGFNVRKKVYVKEYTINEIDINELLKEYEQ